jgi:hypothetical protein
MRHKVWEMRQWTIRGRNLHWQILDVWVGAGSGHPLKVGWSPITSTENRRL